MKLKHGDHKSMKKIVVLGAGVQGTVFGVRLAQRGNEVTLIARPDRAQELRQFGATIQNADTAETSTISLPVMERLASDCSADFCLVTVRREQIAAVLPDLARAEAREGQDLRCPLNSALSPGAPNQDIELAGDKDC